MNSPLAEARYRRLRTTGSVELRQTWGNIVLMLFAVLTLIAAGAFAVIGSIAPGEPWWSAFGHVVAWMGSAVIIAVGALGIVAIPRHVRQRGTLAVTWDGIAEYRMRGGKRVRSMSIPWSDIESVVGRRIGGRSRTSQYVVQLRLTPESWQRYGRDSSPVLRHMAATGNRFASPRSITLQRFEGGGKALHELLGRAHQEFRGGPRLRSRH